MSYDGKCVQLIWVHNAQCMIWAKCR